MAKSTLLDSDPARHLSRDRFGRWKNAPKGVNLLFNRQHHIMMYNPDIEKLGLKQLRQLQNERLQATLQRVYARVPFYQKQFKEHGLVPADIKGVEDLHKLPFTKKEDLRDHNPY